MRTITIPPQIGAILATRRRHLKLTQSAVATRIGLSQNRLSVLEADPATLDTGKLLAWLNALGLEMTLAEKTAGKAKVEW
jgi:HTH-type transcriptional regulator/antitoxin HipB